MAHRTDADIIEKTHNTARFFVEHRHIAWVLLIATVLWGWYGYNSMPQRKDPDIPVRVAVALTPWPGVKAQEVEQLVTRPIEEKIAENSYIHPGTAADYGIDRKSTRLNSSHVRISYAVFCLKKKKKNN